MLCVQTPHRSPLSGPHGRDQGNATGKGGRESDKGRRPCQTQTLSPPTSTPNNFAGWCSVTGQQTLWTAGAHLIPMRNKGLLHDLPHRNLDVCNGSRLRLWAYRFSVHRSDRTKELTGKSRGGGICFFSNNNVVMKGIYTLLNHSAPWSGNSHASVSTILATEGIYNDHSHSGLQTACPYHNATTRWATRSTMLTSAHPHDAVRAVCHLPCTVKNGIHPWK